MKKFALTMLLMAGCQKAPTQQPSSVMLVSEVKKALAEREARLTSFALKVDTTEGEQQARHEFFYRSPNKSRGRLLAPNELEVAFDGTHLVRVQRTEKKCETIKVQDLKPEERAYLLASSFMPFAPEGYRAPLLPQSGVDAKRITRNEGDAVELTIKPQAGISVSYVLRVPSGDFLEKRTLVEGQERVLRMETEQCDEKLRLCVPKKLVEKLGDTLVGTTHITSVELNAALPQDTFSLPCQEESQRGE